MERSAVSVVTKAKQLSTIRSPICDKPVFDVLLNADIIFRDTNHFQWREDHIFSLWRSQ